MADMLDIGNWRVRSVVNGHIRLDGGAMFGVVPKTMWSKVAPADEHNRIRLATRTLVALHRPTGRIVLVDTGTGSKWPADKAARYAIESQPGAIDDALSDIDATPADVSDVVATHLHFDHCGGMTEWVDQPGGQSKPTQKQKQEQRLRFPNARHWVHRRHWEHANNPTRRDRASFLAIDFALLETSGALALVEDDTKAAIDDLRWDFSDGHTPRQLLPRFCAGDDGPDLLFIGDLTPTAAHLPIPWVMAYDIEPLIALAERTRIYRQCREENFLIAFPHDPDKGVVALAFDGDKPHVDRVLA